MLHRPVRSSRCIFALAILAVIFHALMPLAMSWPTQVGMRMALCSTQGAKSIFVQFDTPGKGTPDKDLQAHCPLCLAGTLFALMPPVDAQPVLLSGMGHVQITAPSRMPQAGSGWPAFLSRAPPSFPA